MLPGGNGGGPGGGPPPPPCWPGAPAFGGMPIEGGIDGGIDPGGGTLGKPGGGMPAQEQVVFTSYFVFYWYTKSACLTDELVKLNIIVILVNF